MRCDIRGRLTECPICHGKKVLMVGNELYLNSRGRRCFRYSVIAENPAKIVGFSRKYEYILRVQFEGRKTTKNVSFGHFHNCKRIVA